MCFRDTEPCDLYFETVRKARKSHRCNECGDDISRGDRYRHVHGVFQRSWFRHKECRRCCFDRARLHHHEHADGCNFGEDDPGLGRLLGGLSETDMMLTQTSDVPQTFNFEYYWSPSE